MADERRVLKVEPVHQRLQVGGEGVVVVAGHRLARLPEPASVIRDHTVSGIDQHPDLLVPRPAAEWVAVDQYDRRSRAMVLVVQLDRG
jgi:hypothetical protein